MCEVLNVSRSGYYNWIKKRIVKENNKSLLKKEIYMIWIKSRRTYGAKRIVKDLKLHGVFKSRKIVSDLMKEFWISSVYTRKKYRKPYSYKESFSYPKNILDRQFCLKKQNEAWVSDVTYIRSNKGWMHLCVVIDLYSRKVVGWSVGMHCDSFLVKKALENAFILRGIPKNLLFHSDRRKEYSAKIIQNLLKEKRITVSMSRKRNCWDNSVAESFFKTLKVELIRQINSI